jgi:hypothetical protein
VTLNDISGVPLSAVLKTAMLALLVVGNSESKKAGCFHSMTIMKFHENRPISSGVGREDEHTDINTSRIIIMI